MTQAKQYRRLGKFELHELIGEGAMGVVWKAYDSVLRRYVALKLLPAKVSRTGDIRERFLREARAAGVLQHSNIVTIYDLGEAENQLFIAMELVDGRDLSTIISGHDPLPLERKLDIVIEVLEALTYAHNRGVIHRDIKPSNVRIATDGGIKIMDFGIARLQSAEFTGSGAIVGTPSYMAPEQITNGAIGPATDLFAVGCLLYELLGYRKPFEAETIHGVLYQVLTTDPPALRTTAPAIRAALAGAGQTTERLGPRWTPLPAPVLRLISHAPMRWRVVVLATLALVVALLVSRSSGPPAPAAPLAPPTATLDQLIAEPLPGGLSPALLQPRAAGRRHEEQRARPGAGRGGAPERRARGPRGRPGPGHEQLPRGHRPVHGSGTPSGGAAPRSRGGDRAHASSRPGARHRPRRDAGGHLTGAGGIAVQHDGLSAREDCGARRGAGGSRSRRRPAHYAAGRPPGGDRCAAARPGAGRGERAGGEPPRPHEPVDGAAEHDGMGGLFPAPHAPRRQLPGAAVLSPRHGRASARAGRIPVCAGGWGRPASGPATAGNELHEDAGGLAHRRRALRCQLPLRRRRGAACCAPTSHQARSVGGGGGGMATESARAVAGPMRRSVTGFSRSPPETVKFSPSSFIPYTCHTPSPTVIQRLSPTTRQRATCSPNCAELSVLTVMLRISSSVFACQVPSSRG